MSTQINGMDDPNDPLNQAFPVPRPRRCVLQDWVCQLSFMQQSVLIAAIRGPDGIAKDHQVKRLCRWLRRCVLLSAFDKGPVLNPAYPGGGSFTGPSCCITWVKTTAPIENRHWWKLMDAEVTEYLRHVDELPHHFQLHFMHAAEILGYKFPKDRSQYPAIGIGEWWFHTYLRLVNDMHFYPESEEQMDRRLGDVEADWREREEVTAK